MATYRDFEADRQACASLPAASQFGCTDQFSKARDACSSFTAAYEASKAKEETYIRALQDLKRWDTLKTQVDAQIAAADAQIAKLTLRVQGVDKAISVLKSIRSQGSYMPEQIKQIDNNLQATEQLLVETQEELDEQHVAMNSLKASLEDYNRAKTATDSAKKDSDDAFANLVATAKSVDVSAKVSSYFDCVTNAFQELRSPEDLQQQSQVESQKLGTPYWTYLPKTAYGTVGSEFTTDVTPSNSGPNTQMRLEYSGLPPGLTKKSARGLTVDRNGNSLWSYYIEGTPTDEGTYTVTITATNPNALANQTATTTLQIIISPYTKKSQTITFSPMPSQRLGSGMNQEFDPGATASSGLPVTYVSSNPSVATIVGNRVRISGMGISTITASQAGDDTWGAAPSVQQMLNVNFYGL